MKYEMTIEIVAKNTYDDETARKFSELTPEKRAEQIGELRAEIHRLFIREMDDGAEVDVNVRVEEVYE